MTWMRQSLGADLRTTLARTGIHSTTPTRISQRNATNVLPTKKSGFKTRLKHLFANKTKDCYNCPYIDGCLHRNEEIRLFNKRRSKEIREEAKFLTAERLRNKRFPHNVTISNRKIKEWLNQPHEHYREKNELLLKLKEVFASAKYVGDTSDEGKHKGVIRNHLFEIKIYGDKSTIIVHEMGWGEFHIHSISDGKIPKK